MLHDDDLLMVQAGFYAIYVDNVVAVGSYELISWQFILQEGQRTAQFP